LSKTVGAIDPELLKKICRGRSRCARRVQRRRKKRSRQVPGKPCAWFAAGNLRRSLAVMNSVLEALGKNFSTEKKLTVSDYQWLMNSGEDVRRVA